jgi:uncharacterized protein
MRVRIRVKPGARKEKVGGTHGDALVVAVQAPPVDGKANDAVRKALATAFGVRKQDVVIVAGEKGRDKVVELPGDLSRLDELLRG